MATGLRRERMRNRKLRFEAFHEVSCCLEYTSDYDVPVPYRKVLPACSDRHRRLDFKVWRLTKVWYPLSSQSIAPATLVKASHRKFLSKADQCSLRAFPFFSAERPGIVPGVRQKDPS